LREERAGVFAPAWFDARTTVLGRDEVMINDLVKVADELWDRVWV
jgi:hypothetical protein